MAKVKKMEVYMNGHFLCNARCSDAPAIGDVVGNAEGRELEVLFLETIDKHKVRAFVVGNGEKVIH